MAPAPKLDKAAADKARRAKVMNANRVFHPENLRPNPELLAKANEAREHKPTKNSRHQVKVMASMAMPLETIASIMDLSATTLRKYYPNELSHGASEINARVVLKLFENAMKGNVAAQIYWTKVRLGWSETSKVEIVNESGSVLTEQRSSGDLVNDRLKRIRGRVANDDAQAA